LPRFTFSRVVGVEHETVADGGGAKRGRFQIDSWAATYGEAKANAELAKPALRSALTVAEVIDNPDDRDEETKIFRASFDIGVWE
jgi:hypothetical protein